MLIEITYNVTDVFMSTTETPVYVEISFEQPGGSAAVWGSITGTLSNQTDLQNALNAKFDDPTGTTSQYIRGDGTLATFPALTGYVPYTGATTNVNLGEYELKAGQLTLDTSPTGTAAVGTIRWNDTTGTSETTLKGGNVIIKNGVDLVARVVNKVTPNTTLTKAAYQAVRVSGAQGQRLAIELAQANNDAGSADTIGLVTETIAPNQEGFIMTVGQLEGINTTGSLQGETWADGDVLYLSPTTAGAITNVKPTGATGHLVIIGYVEYAHANNGKIYVKVMNGWELDELHNVSIVTPTNNQGLFYNSSNSLWENKTISTALGYTPVPTTRNITINGVTYDLSADRTWTISTGISGSGASGQVTYWTGASAVSGSADFTWNGNNLVLGNNKGIVLSQAGTNRSISLKEGNILDNFSGFISYPSSGTNVGNALQVSPRGTGFNSTIKSQITIYNTDIVADSTNYELAVFRAGGANYSLSTGKSGTGTTRPLLLSAGFATDAVTNGNQLWLYTSGNVGINTSSDLGTRLGVVGDTLLRGSGATSATTALTVQNSSSTNLFRVANDGFVYGGYVNYVGQNSTNPLTFSFVDGAFTSPGAAGRNLGYFNSNTTQTGDQYHFALSGNTITATSGTHVGIYYSRTFAPTSGSGIFSATNIAPIINQTGGANGITRGLYVNPTLTAAADFRAIETTAGNVLIGWNQNAATSLTITNTTSGTASNANLTITSNNGSFQLAKYSPLTTTYKILLGNDSYIYNNVSGDIAILNDFATGRIKFAAGAVSTSQMTLFANGNLAINSGVTDLGVRLGVVGDTILRGSGATSATTALTVQNSSSTNLFTVRNDGYAAINYNGTSAAANAGLEIISTSATATAMSSLAINGNSATGHKFLISHIGTNSSAYLQNYSTSASNYRGIFFLGNELTFEVTNTDYASRIQALRVNVSGYVGINNISPTALTDIGASTTARASLRIRSGTAPTSPNDGDIWFDGTDIKMRIGGVTKTFTLI